jgi:hypothetical protein
VRCVAYSAVLCIFPSSSRVSRRSSWRNGNMEGKNSDRLN